MNPFCSDTPPTSATATTATATATTTTTTTTNGSSANGSSSGSEASSSSSAACMARARAAVDAVRSERSQSVKPGSGVGGSLARTAARSSSLHLPQRWEEQLLAGREGRNAGSSGGGVVGIMRRSE
ncbi:unnamed protein product [Closterium sp. Naga37s-1]|nr:unnamed protein product [Closterium sp. Naga37s-1]